MSAGTIPDQDWQHWQVGQLWLAGNALLGTLPLSWGNGMPNLTDLGISNNSLNGDEQALACGFPVHDSLCRPRLQARYRAPGGLAAVCPC